MNFLCNHVNIRKSDGAIINTYISPFVSVLHSYGSNGNWSNALKLCRTVKVIEKIRRWVISIIYFKLPGTGRLPAEHILPRKIIHPGI